VIVCIFNRLHTVSPKRCPLLNSGFQWTTPQPNILAAFLSQLGELEKLRFFQRCVPSHPIHKLSTRIDPDVQSVIHIMLRQITKTHACKDKGD